MMGIVFDSKNEALRYCDLVLMERSGEIADLKRQVKYDFVINGIRVGWWTVDHVYIDRKTGNLIAEDYKGGYRLPEDFPLRKNVAQALYPHVEFRLYPERKRRGQKKRKSV